METISLLVVHYFMENALTLHPWIRPGADYVSRGKTKFKIILNLIHWAKVAMTKVQSSVDIKRFFHSYFELFKFCMGNHKSVRRRSRLAYTIFQKSVKFSK